ncbi:hypothetical protein COE03_29785, partial [Bacillus thuringiensis]
YGIALLSCPATGLTGPTGSNGLTGATSLSTFGEFYGLTGSPIFGPNNVLPLSTEVFNTGGFTLSANTIIVETLGFYQVFASVPISIFPSSSEFNSYGISINGNPPTVNKIAHVSNDALAMSAITLSQSNIIQVIVPGTTLSLVTVSELALNAEDDT